MAGHDHTRTGASSLAALVSAAVAITLASAPAAARPAPPGGPDTVVSLFSNDDRDLFPDDPGTPPPPTPVVDPRLGSPTSYSLHKTADGTVVRWNPCAPIHYRVNTRYAAPGALADVKAAVARVHAATGIAFVYDGATTVIPQSTYGSGYNPNSGAPAPPVVIAWAKHGTGAGTSNLLTGGKVVARGGATAMSWTDSSRTVHKLRAVTGLVVVDTAYNTRPGGFLTTSGGTRGGILLHEIGHVMGLMHVSDTTQEMNPYVISRAAYGNGDRAGLAKLGAPAGCLA
ncbi:MAG: hypothetical protein JWM93_2224 [Frankiales bacterium]|nr:hypothetical protein [Frankiales bacterium]